MTYPHTILPYPDMGRSFTFRETFKEYAVSNTRYQRYNDASKTDRTVNVSFTFSAIQFRVWCTFVVRDTKQGTEWFLISLPDADGEYRRVRARLVEGRFNASHIAPDTFKVNTTFDIEPAPDLAHDDTKDFTYDQNTWSFDSDLPF